MPIVRVKLSDAALAKWVFQPRVVRKTETLENTTSTDDSEEASKSQAVTTEDTAQFSEEVPQGLLTREEVQQSELTHAPQNTSLEQPGPIPPIPRLSKSHTGMASSSQRFTRQSQRLTRQSVQLSQIKAEQNLPEREAARLKRGKDWRRGIW